MLGPSDRSFPPLRHLCLGPEPPTAWIENDASVPAMLVRLSGCWLIASGPMLISTNQLEPLYSASWMSPRARMVALAGSETPVNCQPPEMRTPLPTLFQVVPLVETSKEVRQTSGPVPPRCQVIFELL